MAPLTKATDEGDAGQIDGIAGGNGDGLAAADGYGRHAGVLISGLCPRPVARVRHSSAYEAALRGGRNKPLRGAGTWPLSRRHTSADSKLERKAGRAHHPNG